jgi:hypothetical protein
MSGKDRESQKWIRKKGKRRSTRSRDAEEKYKAEEAAGWWNCSSGCYTRCCRVLLCAFVCNATPSLSPGLPRSLPPWAMVEPCTIIRTIPSTVQYPIFYTRHCINHHNHFWFLVLDFFFNWIFCWWGIQPGFSFFSNFELTCRPVKEEKSSSSHNLSNGHSWGSATGKSVGNMTCCFSESLICRSEVSRLGSERGFEKQKLMRFFVGHVMS